MSVGCGKFVGMQIPRAVAVVVDGDRALIIKRYLRLDAMRDCVFCGDINWEGSECPGHHYSVLPGGGVEDGETAEEAALRELTEETTLGARIDRLLWTGKHFDRPATYFLMTEVTGTPVLSGPEAAEHCADNHFELRWARADEFEDLNLRPPAIRRPLAELLQ